MVELNNGDALSCIVLMLDSLAHSNNSIVEIETLIRNIDTPRMSFDEMDFVSLFFLRSRKCLISWQY